MTQGEVLVVNNNLTFRMERHAADFPGFEGRDLSAKGFIELEPNTSFCDEILDVEFIDRNTFIDVYPNPAHDHVVIELSLIHI